MIRGVDLINYFKDCLPEYNNKVTDKHIKLYSSSKYNKLQMANLLDICIGNKIKLETVLLVLESSKSATLAQCFVELVLARRCNIIQEHYIIEELEKYKEDISNLGIIILKGIVNHQNYRMLKKFPKNLKEVYFTDNRPFFILNSISKMPNTEFLVSKKSCHITKYYEVMFASKLNDLKIFIAKINEVLNFCGVKEHIILEKIPNGIAEKIEINNRLSDMLPVLHRLLNDYVSGKHFFINDVIYNMNVLIICI